MHPIVCPASSDSDMEMSEGHLHTGNNSQPWHTSIIFPAVWVFLLPHPFSGPVMGSVSFYDYGEMNVITDPVFFKSTLNYPIINGQLCMLHLLPLGINMHPHMRLQWPLAVGSHPPPKILRCCGLSRLVRIEKQLEMRKRRNKRIAVAFVSTLIATGPLKAFLHKVILYVQSSTNLLGPLEAIFPTE